MLSRNPHLTFFPVLGADELLYSWLGHVHHRCGFGNSFATSEHLFGNPHGARLHDFTCRLGEFDIRTNSILGDPADLAIAHTLLGHFAVLLPRQEADLIIASAVHEKTPRLRLRLGIPGGKLGGANWLKFCSACVEQDHMMFGRPVWHCLHQYPTAILCHIHKVPLTIAWHPITPVHRTEWVTPLTGFSEAITYKVTNSESHDVLSSLTDATVSFTELGPAGLDAQRVVATLRRRAFELGALTSAGSIRRPQLSAALHRPFSEIKTCFEGMGVCSIPCDLEAIIRIIMNSVRPSRHPLKQLFAITTFFGRWDEFRTAYDRELPAPPLAPAGDSPVAIDPQAKVFVQSVRHGVPVVANAHMDKPTTTAHATTTRLAPYKARARKLRPGMISRAHALLMRGTNPRKVAAAISASPAEIYYLLSCDADLKVAWQKSRDDEQRARCRQRFLDAVKNYPNATIKDVRKSIRNEYAWLYRHDRTWLQSTTSHRGNLRRLQSFPETGPAESVP
jgi:hypothetical protein